jgi:hypothetical protein
MAHRQKGTELKYDTAGMAHRQTGAESWTELVQHGALSQIRPLTVSSLQLKSANIKKCQYQKGGTLGLQDVQLQMAIP